ncbi:WD40-repeat-containing domain protein [Bisporella sp. PMI_857]|nr:WD40-repeat-containing domain protein [Bisporella sp. PMI_857]
MSRSKDPGHFFQTDASESARARKAAKSHNTNGNPIVLRSKILNIVPDPQSSSCVYVAESAGCVRRVNIESKDSKTVYRGPAAPLTSVAIGGVGGATIFAGCWDKDVWSWNRDSTALVRKYKGHSDFVKAVICTNIEGKQCVISGGADSKIIVWDAETGDRIHTLRDKSDNMMALQDLVIDPEDSTESEIVLFSCSSDPYIRRWRINLESASQIVDSGDGVMETLSSTNILAHETSVYKLLFAGDGHYSNLWTASADGTAKCLSRLQGWRVDDSYEHGDYVRALVVTEDWVVTAGRNEDVKVWDKATGKLHHVYEGHFEEITGLAVMYGEKNVVSVSIDGSVRTWGLDKVELEQAIMERDEKARGLIQVQSVEPTKTLLTAEEEAELAELMDSGDE